MDLLIYKCPSCGRLNAREETGKVNICSDHAENKEMELMGIAELQSLSKQNGRGEADGNLS